MKSHSSNEATVSSRWLLAKLIPWHGDARCVIRYSMNGFLVTSPRVKASESLTTALNVWPFVVWLFQLWALNTVIIPVYFVTINHKFGQCLGTYEAPSRLIECLTRIRRYSDHMLKKQLHVFFGGIILMSIMLVAKEMPNTWQISTPDYLDKNMKSSTTQQLTIVDPLFTHLWFIRFRIQSYSTHNPCTTEAEKRCRPPALDRYDFEPRRLSSPDLQFLPLLSS